MLDWMRIFRRSCVSGRWLREHARHECGQGWDGPRWRFPEEVKEQRRLELKRRLAILRHPADRQRFGR